MECYACYRNHCQSVRDKAPVVYNVKQTIFYAFLNNKLCRIRKRNEHLACLISTTLKRASKRKHVEIILKNLVKLAVIYQKILFTNAVSGLPKLKKISNEDIP